MKYLCIVFVDEKKLQALTASEGAALNRDSLEYDRELKASGHFIAAEALQPVSTAATVRIREGKVSITDGPFAETHEQVGGFILIDARDLNEAIRIASNIPVAKFGGVEVRPIYQIPA